MDNYKINYFYWKLFNLFNTYRKNVNVYETFIKILLTVEIFCSMMVYRDKRLYT